MQWIDANVEVECSDPSGARVLGVCYRSECGRYHIAVNSLNIPEHAREWLLWDMTGAAPMVLARGFESHTVAMRFGDGVAASRVFRVALRLAAIGRAVAASVRRLTA